MYSFYRCLSHYINGFRYWKLLGLFFLINLGSNAVAKEPILHVVTESLPPLQIAKKGEQPEGAMVELVQAVLKDANVDASITAYPWARSYELARTQPNTIIFSMMKTDNRLDKFIWIGEVYRSSVYLVKLRSRKDLKIDHLDDAINHRIGVVRLDISQEYLIDKGFEEGKNLLISSGYPRLWYLLYTGKIDYLLANEFMWKLEERTENILRKDVEAAIELTDFAKNYYLAANKQTSPEIIKKLTQSLEKIKKSGQYQHILNKWQL